MAEYKVSEEKARKFLAKKLDGILRRSGKGELTMSMLTGISRHQISAWRRGQAIPRDPIPIIRVYAMAEATDKEFAALRKSVIEITDEELQSHRRNNRPEIANPPSPIKLRSGMRMQC